MSLKRLNHHFAGGFFFRFRICVLMNWCPCVFERKSVHITSVGKDNSNSFVAKNDVYAMAVCVTRCAITTEWMDNRDITTNLHINLIHLYKLILSCERALISWYISVSFTLFHCITFDSVVRVCVHAYVMHQQHYEQLRCAITTKQE